MYSYLSEEHYKSVDFRTICGTTTHLVISPVEPSEDGHLQRMMQYPDEALLDEARSYGCNIVLGFGANYHSGSFAKMLKTHESRVVFLGEIASLVRSRNITGIDYFTHAQAGTESTQQDSTPFFAALQHIVYETRQLFGDRFWLSLSYYPIDNQERIISQLHFPQVVDFLHLMAFDLPGPHHASGTIVEDALKRALEQGLPLSKLTLGLPLFGRHSKTKERVPYEQLARRYNPIDHSVDIVLAKARIRIDVPTISFNGRDTIMRKTTFAGQIGLAGVSVWEVGAFLFTTFLSCLALKFLLSQ